MPSLEPNRLTKGQRQRLIADWLRAGEVGSQDELVARLAEAGVSATQATVSRDLEALGAVKVRGGYALASARDASGDARLGPILGEWVTEIIAAGTLLVLKTPPGSANLVANAIDVARLGEVAGTIAGDDTIFVALADGVTPGAAVAMFRARRSGG
jgi:transcriptional regulator of arginine metabolism